MTSSTGFSIAGMGLIFLPSMQVPVLIMDLSTFYFLLVTVAHYQMHHYSEVTFFVGVNCQILEFADTK